MKVFVAGGSGVLGRATIRQLRAHGHTVVALVRSEGKARLVHDLGAEPVIGDLLDLNLLRPAVQGADVVMHLATAIPQKTRPRAADWVMNDRLRREGTRNLIAATREQPLHAYIQQSVAFLYGDRNGQWINEDTPLPPRVAANLRSAVDAERYVLAAYNEFGLPGVVLRGATFYAPDSWHTRSTIDAVKHRTMPILGSGDQYWHYIYVEDMAAACVCAAETPAPGEIFFVADDWPFHARDFLNYLAAQLNAPAPLKMSVTLARLLGGGLVPLLAHSVRYRTDKIKKMIGWRPRYPTFREGFAEIWSRLGVNI